MEKLLVLDGMISKEILPPKQEQFRKEQAEMAAENRRVERERMEREFTERWLLPVIPDEKSTEGSQNSDSSSQFSLLELESGESESTGHPSSSMPHSDSSDPVSEIDSLNRTPPVDTNLNDPNTATVSLRKPSVELPTFFSRLRKSPYAGRFTASFHGRTRIK
jgi:hypothetical protein